MIVHKICTGWDSCGEFRHSIFFIQGEGDENSFFCREVPIGRDSYETKEEEIVSQFEVVTPTEESDPNLLMFARAVLEGTEMKCPFSFQFRQARREERRLQIEQGS